MKLLRIQHICWLVAFVAHGCAITPLAVLQSYSELSTLYAYVNSSPNLTSLLSSPNNFTFLATSNTAISNFLFQNPNHLTADLLEATLQYSLLRGGYPTLSFSNTPQFVESNLVNASYTNVTGGQRVELLLDSSGKPQIVTGNKSISTSTSTVRSKSLKSPRHNTDFTSGYRLHRRHHSYSRRSSFCTIRSSNRDNCGQPRILHLHPE